jgi:hypothetical protein
MSAARKGKGPSTRDKVVSSALAVGAMAGIAGLLAFQTAQVASASSPSNNSISGTAVSSSGSNAAQASFDQPVSAANKGGKSLTGSRTPVKPSVTAPQSTNNAPQAKTKGS